MFYYIVTFGYGFLSGLLCNYLIKLYKSYKYYNDFRKTMIHEAYSYVSNKIFTIVVDDLITNVSSCDINGIANLNEFKNLIDSSINITKEFNKSYKLSINNGKIQLKLNNPNYINDPYFTHICKFFTDNDVDLHIIVDDTYKLDNKIELDSKNIKTD